MVCFEELPKDEPPPPKDEPEAQSGFSSSSVSIQAQGSLNETLDHVPDVPEKKAEIETVTVVEKVQDIPEEDV